jgi:predicted nucleic acid-binding protein
MARTWAPVAR